MSNWGWVILGWATVSGVLGGYAARMLARGRKLSQAVPPEDRRWT